MSQASSSDFSASGDEPTVKKLPLLLLAVALAGCHGNNGSRDGILPPGSLSLATLPAQGLVDESRGGVTLRDMRGRRLVWLRGFAVYPDSAAPQASAAYGFLFARLSEPLLHGPKGWYRLDAPRHALLPVTGGRLSLAGGTTVIARHDLTFAVERNGRVVLGGSAYNTFRILSPRLVQSGTTLLDVETERSWRLPPGCLTAGFDGKTLMLACGVAHAAEGTAPLRLERMEPGSAAQPITPALAQLIPEAASLSPNGAWVAFEGDTGCAASYVYLAPVRGGTARIVYGRSTTEPFAANYSSLLGWTADGRIVVVFMPPHCDAPYGPQHPPRGVYLVDPRTLARTFVTRTAVAMWNPAPSTG
jgi:hypothetical protein